MLPHAFCWALSLLFCILTAFFLDPRPGGICFTNPTVDIFILIASIGVAFVWNLILIALIIRQYVIDLRSVGKFPTKASSDSSGSTTTSIYDVPARLSLYLLVFFLTWATDLLDDCLPFALCPLWYLTAVLNNLQGALDCLVYGLVHKPMVRNYSLLSGLICFVFAPFLLLPTTFLRAINYFKAPETDTQERIPLLSASSSFRIKEKKKKASQSSSQTHSRHSSPSWQSSSDSSENSSVSSQDSSSFSSAEESQEL
jgi:hypothetical protein